jgi:hypothetical protein
MASKHILSLEVPTVANCEILSIRDTSQYSNLLAIDCEELLITVPGFNAGALIKVIEGFFLDITACDLGIQKENCSEHRSDLPDGVYIIKYSVAPNDKVYVEYNHLRVTKILNLYYKTLCDIDLQTCEPFSEKQSLIQEMQFIRTLIDGAIAKVEYCSSPSLGMEMYNYALSRLEKIVCKTIGCH